VLPLKTIDTNFVHYVTEVQEIKLKSTVQIIRSRGRHYYSALENVLFNKEDFNLHKHVIGPITNVTPGFVSATGLDYHQTSAGNL
jgi:hypothetical protein